MFTDTRSDCATLHRAPPELQWSSVVAMLRQRRSLCEHIWTSEQEYCPPGLYLHRIRYLRQVF